MKFERYQSLKRFGTTEVEGIEFGKCYIFPKLDGTNASIWLGYDGHPAFGSRNRQLSLDNDNAGFMAYWCEIARAADPDINDRAINIERLVNFFDAHPDLRLYGEWLVPHSLKTYRSDWWNKFYVFDVMKGDQYLAYDQYAPILEEFGIDYIQPLAEIDNPTYDDLLFRMKNNFYGIEDGKGIGEGIVIKNYGYLNKFGHVCWAKMVSNEFKEKNAKKFGHMKTEGADMVELQIAEKYVTEALVDKTYAKIENENGGCFEAKFIPQLLNRCFYDVVNEDIWEAIKEHKNPVINFKTLQSACYAQVKKHSKLFAG